MAVAFVNIFMSAVETEIINKSKTKPLRWKRYIDEVLSLWDTKREEKSPKILETADDYLDIESIISRLKNV